MTRIFSLAIFITAAVFTLLPDHSWALDMEYYTYGGFEAVRMVLERIALIFSDSAYKALFFSVAVLGIFFAGVFAYYSLLARGNKGSSLAWAWPVGLGILIYLALVVPKGRIFLYDPVLNRTSTIAGIPDGIVAVSGILSKIENGIIEIVETSGDPTGYGTNAGGIGFSALKGLSQPTMNAYLTSSLQKYVEDCVFFELSRPGTTLTIESLRRTDDLLQEYAKAASPSVYTVYFDDSTPEGRSMACSAAWTTLSSILSNPSTYTDAVKDGCAKAGYDVSNVNEAQQCKTAMDAVLSSVLQSSVSGVDNLKFAQQMALSKAMAQVISYQSDDSVIKTLTAQNTQSAGIAMGIVANEWIPVIRAVITAIAIGLIPFIALMIPTGFVGRAVSLICGFFVWLTCWGVIDSLIHGIAMNYSINMMETIRTHKLGFVSLMLFPDLSQKALSMFGFIRTAGIMLATVVSGMIIRFGGHALSMMASNFMGTLQSAGAMGGHVVSSAEGIGQKMSSISSGMTSAGYYGMISPDTEATLNSRVRVGEFIGTRDAYTTAGLGNLANVPFQAALEKGISFGGHGRALANMNAMEYTDAGTMVSYEAKMNAAKQASQLAPVDLLGPKRYTQAMINKTMFDAFKDLNTIQKYADEHGVDGLLHLAKTGGMLNMLRMAVMANTAEEFVNTRLGGDWSKYEEMLAARETKELTTMQALNDLIDLKTERIMESSPEMSLDEAKVRAFGEIVRDPAIMNILSASSKADLLNKMATRYGLNEDALYAFLGSGGKVSDKMAQAMAARGDAPRNLNLAGWTLSNYAIDENTGALKNIEARQRTNLADLHYAGGQVTATSVSPEYLKRLHADLVKHSGSDPTFRKAADFLGGLLKKGRAASVVLKYDANTGKLASLGVEHGGRAEDSSYIRLNHQNQYYYGESMSLGGVQSPGSYISDPGNFHTVLEQAKDPRKRTAMLYTIAQNVSELIKQGWGLKDNFSKEEATQLVKSFAMKAGLDFSKILKFLPVDLGIGANATYSNTDIKAKNDIAAKDLVFHLLSAKLQAEYGDPSKQLNARDVVGTIYGAVNSMGEITLDRMGVKSLDALKQEKQNMEAAIRQSYNISPHSSNPKDGTPNDLNVLQRHLEQVERDIERRQNAVNEVDPSGMLKPLFSKYGFVPHQNLQKSSGTTTLTGPRFRKASTNPEDEKHMPLGSTPGNTDHASTVLALSPDKYRDMMNWILKDSKLEGQSNTGHVENKQYRDIFNQVVNDFFGGRVDSLLNATREHGSFKQYVSHQQDQQGDDGSFKFKGFDTRTPGDLYSNIKPAIEVDDSSYPNTSLSPEGAHAGRNLQASTIGSGDSSHVDRTTDWQTGARGEYAGIPGVGMQNYHEEYMNKYGRAEMERAYTELGISNITEEKAREMGFSSVEEAKASAFNQLVSTQIIGGRIETLHGLVVNGMGMSDIAEADSSGRVTQLANSYGLYPGGKTVNPNRPEQESTFVPRDKIDHPEPERTYTGLTVPDSSATSQGPEMQDPLFAPKPPRARAKAGQEQALAASILRQDNEEKSTGKTVPGKENTVRPDDGRPRPKVML